MHCSGLITPWNPGFSSSSTIAFPTATYKHHPILRFKPVTRFSHASFNVKTAVQEGIATAMSFYELLGIPESGTLMDIKQAYKQVARKYHPDVSPPDRIEEYTQRFIQVKEAYETLSDPKRRALYDRDMARGLDLAFSSRRRFQNDDELEVRGEWKNNWEAQLSELERRSMNKDAEGYMYWAARMRRQREGSS